MYIQERLYFYNFSLKISLKKTFNNGTLKGVYVLNLIKRY